MTTPTRTRTTKQRIVIIAGAAVGLCLCSIIGAALITPTPPSADIADPVVVTRIVEVTRIVPEPSPTPAPIPDTPTPAPDPSTPAAPTPAAPTATPPPSPTPHAPAPIPAAAPAPDAALPAALSGLQPAQVRTVTDGDTISVTIDGQTEDIRYIGIDAPEDNSLIGRQAAAANADLVNGQTVYLQPDTTERDQYDRLLRYVYLADGRMVNQQLVRAGHALSIPYPPDTAHQSDFDAAQQQAQADSAGMWQTLAWATGNANIRSGPGTGYPVVDAAQPGQALDLNGRSAAGDWLKLATGGWIFANLVANAPADLPVTQAPATDTPPAARAAPAVPIATATAAPPAAPVAVCQCSGIDYDCANFSTWSAAQSCFTYCLQLVGYDVHRLDRDNDGIVCESMR